MSSSYEKVFSERKREPSLTFARRRETPATSFNPKITVMLEEVLEALNAIGPRLDAIEKGIEDIKEVLGIGKISAITDKQVKKRA